jgi:hypothetical protein
MIRDWGRARMAALLCFALALMIPSAASAATYCVHFGGSCQPGELDEGSNLQGALMDANATGVADQVKVAAGTYTGPFTYAGAGGAVQITGAGPSTILNAGAANGVTVLSVSNAGSRVESLHIDVPAGNSGTTRNIGLNLAGTADGLSVQLPNSLTQWFTGVLLTNGTFRNGSVFGPTPTTDPGTSIVGIAGGGTSLIESSTIRAFRDLDLSGGGTIRRVDAVGQAGLFLQGETVGGGSGKFLVEDSLLQSIPGEASASEILAGCGSSTGIQLTARNVTLNHSAPAGQAIAAVCNTAFSAVLDVTSTVVTGSGTTQLAAFANTGAATVNVSYSDFDPSKTVAVGPGGAAINSGPGNLNLSPRFAAPTDFHLGAGSPLIDVGDPAGLAAGESPVDLGGGARILNGTGACSGLRRDIGAYEAAALPMPASCTPVTAKKCKKHKKKHKRSAEIAKKHKKKCKKHKKKH